MSVPVERSSAEGPRALSHGRTNARVLELLMERGVLPRGRVLDVGAGQGYFAELAGRYVQEQGAVDPATALAACDPYPEQFAYTGIRCDRLVPGVPLPYADSAFDAVVCIEVVEHVEDPFALTRELFRVVKPGGRVFITTPNLLNINSRLRFLHSGFWLLFDPLSLSSTDAIHTSGHIHPITFYYLAYALRRAGFRSVVPHFDRRKRSAMALGILLGPLVAAMHAGAQRRWRRKLSALTLEENAELLPHLNSVGMLTSRSVIVEAVR
ncbi:MAG TPA: class I SAM-dependent methyltransferase [Gemmatimonadaceae bacterium]|nr:class I SAM-dependent methyltransferase [Gemmatimonadaceae bacterium]